jgi:hypothetical protein
MSVDTPGAAGLERWRRWFSQVRLGAVIAIAVAVGVGAWFLLRDDEEDATRQPAPPASSAGPEPVSLAALRARAAAVDQPVYWAGRLPGRKFELTETSGRIYVRYLPQGAKVGATKPYLTVATYRHADAFAATTAVAERSGAVRIDVGTRGVAFFNRSQPTSVYLAYRGSPYQIEVFHPVPRIARELVSSRQVRPIRAG